MAIRVEIRQETVAIAKPGQILVYDDDGKLVAEITAKVELKPGADGEFYPCATLSLQKNKPEKH